MSRDSRPLSTSQQGLLDALIDRRERVRGGETSPVEHNLGFDILDAVSRRRPEREEVER